MSKIEVNEIVKSSGSTLTIGGCGTAVTLGSGATQSGFGRSGSVDWQTTPKTSTFTAVNGEGYFINASGAITMNLPAGSAGAIVAVSDYARNFGTHGQAATFVYVDSTKGWINVQNAEDTETGITPSFYAATGGTITTVCTNFKVHTFTSPGTFCVSSVGNEAGGGSKVAYMVIAGAGGGGSAGGGGGAGGFREGKCSVHSYTASPLATTGLAICSTGGIPITVGAGGSGGTSNATGGKGSNTIFGPITSAGGGAGKGHNVTPAPANINGGSGGGGGSSSPSDVLPGGSGNTPPVSPSQGNDGGTGVHPASPAPVAGGGGGAGSAFSPLVDQNGGSGATTSINATPTVRAGGGGAGPNGNAGTGGAGSGGTPGGGPSGTAPSGTANTGSGGGGGAPFSGSTVGGAGGSGIVIIRYKFQ